MGGVIEFVVLYLCGVMSHYFYIWKGKRAKNPMWIVNYGVICYLAVLLFDILLYAGALPFVVTWANMIPWIGSPPFTNGADLWWNGSRIFGIGSTIVVNSSMLKEAIMIWLAYLPVYLFGKMGSQLFFGRRTFQQGAIWALLPINEAKSKEQPK
jgi:hypothetical protein